MYWLLFHSMELSKEGNREIIWHMWRKGILHEILEMFGHKSPSKATIYRWIEQFENGEEVIHDGPHLGRPTSSKIRTNIEAVRIILNEDRGITLRALEERVGMLTATVHSSIHKDLEMSKVSARWFPKFISE